MCVVGQFNLNLKKHLQSFTANPSGKCKRKRHTINNPDFFIIDETFDICINNQNKKFDL